MMQAVATSGRSVYRTLGKGFQNCRGDRASATDSWLMAMEPTCIFSNFSRISASSSGSASPSM